MALTKQGSGTLTMAVSLVNLTPNSASKIRFSGNGCGNAVGPNIANNFAFNSDSNGTAFTNTVFDDQAAFNAKTMRLFRGGNQVDCAITGDYDGDGDVDGADYLTIMNKPGARGIVDVHRTNNPSVDKFNVALSSLVDGADYVLWFSTAACGSPNHPANQIMSYSFEASQTGSFHTSTQLTHDPEFENWASVRIVRDGQQVACGKVHTTYAT